jgi:hypothetical protein
VLGLTVRWNTYRTIYYDDPTLRNETVSPAAQALIAKLNLPNSFQPNPARSLLVGVIGLWRAGEPACEPGDRALLSQLPDETVGTAFAKVGPDRLTLDLGNSVAEVDAECSKQQLGTLSVCAMSPDGKSVVEELGTIDYAGYDRDAYVATAGMIDLPLTPELAGLARGAPLQIRSGDTVYLSEPPLLSGSLLLRAVPSADQNIYMNQHDDTGRAELHVLNLGSPAGEGITVTRFAWCGQAMTYMDTAQTDASGIASFPLAVPPAGAVQSFVFTAGADAPPPPQLDPQLTPYIYVRTLPADDAVGAMEPTWQNVYTYVLANWKAMAPCMDNWLKLDDPAQVHAFGPMLKKLTAWENFEDYRYMPVVRDMTAGERTLLYKFLDSPLAPEATMLRASAAPAPAEPRLPNIHALNRAMRGN